MIEILFNSFSDEKIILFVHTRTCACNYSYCFKFCFDVCVNLLCGCFHRYKNSGLPAACGGRFQIKEIELNECKNDARYQKSFIYREKA